MPVFDVALSRGAVAAIALYQKYLSPRKDFRARIVCCTAENRALASSNALSTKLDSAKRHHLRGSDSPIATKQRKLFEPKSMRRTMTIRVVALAPKTLSKMLHKNVCLIYVVNT